MKEQLLDIKKDLGEIIQKIDKILAADIEVSDERGKGKYSHLDKFFDEAGNEIPKIPG